ncbi:hypothetical protein [Lentzea sp. NPDC004782]|uniref:hypothetical protein n=1 Tax=Lentzea sp. NPDC004782 TaxID=3154458 RepID=UPI0033B24543
MKQHSSHWMIRVLAVAVAVVAALAVSPLGSAQAATPGVFELCSGGDFSSYAEFVERGGFSTYVVEPGTCQQFAYGGDHAERVDIHVLDGQYIGSLVYDGRAGVNVCTVNGPSFYVF